MDLSVGIVGSDPGWQALLAGEGIPWRSVRPPFRSGDHAVLVVGASAGREVVPALRSYLNDGGAVLTGPAHAPTLAGVHTRRRHVSSLVPFREPAFAGIDVIDIHASAEIPDRAQILPQITGEPTAFIGREGNGHLLLLPFDIPKLIEDDRVRTKSFPSPAPRLPFERVAVVSKGSLRSLAVRSIELLFHRRGLPFARVWPFPSGAPSVFSLRIDTDYGTEAEVDALYRFAHDEQIPMTWFVHVGAQQSMLRRFAGMEGQEIGVHCYRHRSFHDPNAQAEDLGQALTALREAGVHPKGFAAPFGRWTSATESAVRTHGLEYSSEFSLGYDDIPFRPGEGSGVLQIPIHPICLGSMRRQSYDAEQAFAYFDAVLRRSIVLRRPAIFYHHPKDGPIEVLRRILARVREEKIPMLSMSAFAGWWEHRERVRMTAELRPGEVQVRMEGGGAEARVRIARPDGAERFVPPGERVSLSAGMWTLPPVPEFSSDELRSRQFNYRIPIVRGLDAVTGIFKRKDDGR